MTTEKSAFKINGFIMLIISLALVAASVYCYLQLTGAMIAVGVILDLVAVLIFCGFVIVFPNNVAVLTFFGRYTGCIRSSGFWFVIPFSNSIKVSVRVVNFNSERLKVNDVAGNPVEIAAVVVYRVIDAAKAVFDVNSYLEFVEIQSETALRHVAAKYPYDNFEDEGVSLRKSADVVAQELQNELEERLAVAGVEIMEARLTHLAYATEIASAMLQRQQAAAILAARQIVVDGAVGMAQMAIERLEKDNTVELDEERKMAMINNLMVTIVSDRSAQPVINTGSLY
ncbi:MAG: SPFH domain-containing protein [Bacillota bacterium]|nr:SPFH domain-containing protein [Bacillota bacterium]